LAIGSKTQPDARTTSNTRSLLGDTLLGQKKVAEVEPLLLEGHDGTNAAATCDVRAPGLALPAAHPWLCQLNERRAATPCRPVEQPAV
jgi:hypothetical protein